MKLNDLVNKVNEKLAGERLSYDKMRGYLDSTIDDINSKLNATYPVFSDLPVGTTEYNFFPDRFIRSVVVPGAAWYFFVVDEEGIVTAGQLQLDYLNSLFVMQRDYLTSVPVEYQGPQTGYLFENEEQQGARGLSYDGTIVLP
jgi:hypothetical protein